VCIVDVDFATQQAVIMPMAAPAGGGDPQRTSIRFAELLRIIDIGETGAVSWQGMARLLTNPPEGVAFRFPPPPPPGAPPMSPGATVDISGDDDNNSLAYLRAYLSGLTTFGTDVDWSKASFFHVVDMLGTITTRLKLSQEVMVHLPPEGRLDFAKRAGALLGLKYSMSILDRAASYTNDRVERAELLRQHDKSVTPQKPTPPDGRGAAGGQPRSLARDAAPPRAPERPERPERPGASRDEWRGAQMRRGVLNGIQSAEGGAEPADDMDDDSDDSDEEPHPKRGKKQNKKSNAKDAMAYPTLADFCPDSMSIGDFAKMLTQGDHAATTTVNSALSSASIPSRLVWSQTTSDTAEATLSVAVEAMTEAGLTLPPRPPRASGVPALINALLAGLQKIALKTTARDTASAHMGSEPHHMRPHHGVSATLAYRPADDFERCLSHSASVSHSVLESIRSSSGTCASWARKAKGTSGNQITPGAPLDILRLQMADKFTQRELSDSLSPDLSDAIAAELRARAHLASAAMERCMRVKLPSDIEKKVIDTLLPMKLSKMPSLAEISKETTVKDMLGNATRTTTAASPIQAIAALRAGLMAAWPEYDFMPLLAAEDDIRSLLLGKHEAQAGQKLAEARAGQLWLDVRNMIERNSDAFRNGTLLSEGSPATPYDLLGREQMHALLDKNYEANLAATSLMASFQLTPGTNFSDQGSSSGTVVKKKPLISLFKEWRSSFGTACAYHWTKGCSMSADVCQKVHEEAKLDPAEVKKWVVQNNADVPTPPVRAATILPPSACDSHAASVPAPLLEPVMEVGLADAHERIQSADVAAENEALTSALSDAAPADPCPANEPEAASAHTGTSMGTTSDARHITPSMPQQRAAPNPEIESKSPPHPTVPNADDTAATVRVHAPSQRELHERSSPPAHWPKPLPPVLEQQLMHEEAIMRLRTLPEGQAIARAEAECIGPLGMYDPLRARAEDEQLILHRPTRSVVDRAISTVRQPTRFQRWCQERRDAGTNIYWRPSGDATTLFLPGKEHGIREVNLWVDEMGKRTCQLFDGEEPDPLAELHHVTKDWLMPEAEALQPWWIHGEYFDKPVPMAFVFQNPEPRGAEHSVNTQYYAERAQAGDTDQDICFQISASGGLDAGCDARDLLCTRHVKSMWADEATREKSINAVEKEIKSGAFRVFEGGVPCYPIRQPPRFAVDEGFQPDGSRKIRAIVHHSHPKPIDGSCYIEEGSTNSNIDLSRFPQLKMGSGRAFWGNTDPLIMSGEEVLTSKRDGKNAFRQLDMHPLDWWLSALVWPCRETWLTKRVRTRRVLLDGAVPMGLSSAMVAFGRAVDVPARHVVELSREIDCVHQPTSPELKSFLSARSGSLGEAFGKRLDTDDQFCDDSLRAGINDQIEIKFDLPSSIAAFLARHEGTTMGREEAKLIAYDYVWEELLCMTMDHADKRITTDSWMEALGVEGSVSHRRMRYPARKRPGMIATIDATLREQAANKCVRRDDLHTLVSQEKWLAHVALEVNSYLAASWAVVRSPGSSNYVTMSAKSIEDQTLIKAILETKPTMPLSPRSSFPPFISSTHILTFQDASTSFGAGGWALINSHLHGIRIKWPDWVKNAFEQKLWSVSPAELWIERVVLRIVGHHANTRIPVYITAFTDNESARAAANKLSSSSHAMSVIAEDMAAWLDRMGGVCKMITARTMRVTTTENATADKASRSDGDDALQQLALELGVQLTIHSFEHDDPMWDLVSAGFKQQQQ
jgi:hypothetical protein